MTNHWVDLQNCKTILVEGSNVAENHPMAYKWIRKAQENGAKLIHVDPRYTRTSAGADVYARIRPGTDAAFQNTMINHIIVNKLYDEDYVVTHTNALYLGDEAFDFKDGLFSGYDAEHHTYDTKTWGYQLDAKGKPRIARSLDDPHCVFSRLKTFVSRYTLEMGERITGIPADQIRQIAEMMAKNRPGSILYALGMTQHTTGVQGIRSFTILQLLLGNIGKPGGGVNALRGEPNVQGACDMAVLYNYYPGYLNSPTNAEPTIYHYVRKNGIADSRYLVNMLKAFFGDAATTENDYGYEWLPKRDAAKDYGTLPMFEDALAGKLKLLWIVGQNPAVTLPNLKLTFEAMAKLETLVVQEIWETETAAFWKPARRRPEVHQHRGDPAARGVLHGEERHHQQLGRHGAVAPRRREAAGAGQARRRDRGPRLPQSARSGQGLEGAEGRDHPQGLLDLHHGRGRPARDQRLRRARQPGDRDSRKAISSARSAISSADGSTSSGAWIYAGVFANGENLSKRRDSTTDPGGLGLYPGFGWTWPNNMRILYNRASCDRNGKPYPGSKPIVWWDEQAKRWTGHDVPDVPVATDGPDTPNGQRAFHLGAEGVGRLFAAVYSDPDPRYTDYWRDVAYVPKDGPLPEMYEPVESPVENVLHPGVKSNPTLKYPRVAVASADRHRRQVPLRADDVDGRRTLVLRLDDAEHPLAQRARARTDAGAAGHPRPEARHRIGRLGPGLVGAR